jgi:membrane-bound metal-dependent hydrolase YbcI (DUF457 family)
LKPRRPSAHALDVLTHGFLPYAAATWLRRPSRERAAAAIGGFAPDLDTTWAWSASLDAHLYPLVHRGASHTLVGAPLMALLFFAFVGLLGRRWPRLRFGPLTAVAPALLLGALSHLVLDMLTITGVPLLWPFSDVRWTTNWFFFSVPYMVPVALVLWIPVWRGRAGERWVKRGSLVLLAVLLAAGALRFASYPHDATPQERVTPGATDWTWILTRRNETGVVAQGVSWGHRGAPVFFPETNRTAAASAVEACLRAPGSTAWRWGEWGEHVAGATRAPDGGWNVTLRDSARLFMEHDASNALGRRVFGTEDDRALRCHVGTDGSVRVERRGGFWG